MQEQTYALVENYIKRIAQLNGIDAERIRRGQQFAATPQIDQRIREAIKESSAFLSMVNFLGVDNQQGEALGLGATTTIAGTKDTSGGSPRAPADPTGFTQNPYNATQTNFDVSLRYDKLDAWRHLPNFEVLWNQAIAVQMALDIVMTGFNGTSRAATSDRVTYPLLQDVNIGWLQKMRANNAARWIDEGATAGELRVGADTGADYLHLDEMVFDLARLLHDRYANDPELVVMIGRELITDKYQSLVGATSTDAPTERAAIDRYMLGKTLGGLPAYTVPFFPARSLLITRFDNLSVYEQNGTRRRTVKDEPELDRYADYQSINQAFVVEHYEAAVGCENVTYKGEGTW